MINYHLALLAYLFCLYSNFWNFLISPASKIYILGYHYSLFLLRKLLGVMTVYSSRESLKDMRFLVDFLISSKAESSCLTAVTLP